MSSKELRVYSADTAVKHKMVKLHIATNATNDRCRVEETKADLGRELKNKYADFYASEPENCSRTARSLFQQGPLLTIKKGRLGRLQTLIFDRQTSIILLVIFFVQAHQINATK